MTTLRTTSTRVNYAPNAPGGPALAANAARAGLVVTNRSGVACYLHFGAEDASGQRFTYVLGPGAVLDLHPASQMYDGPITYAWDAPTSGFLMISEWLRAQA